MFLLNKGIISFHILKIVAKFIHKNYYMSKVVPILQPYRQRDKGSFYKFQEKIKSQGPYISKVTLYNKLKESIR